jgi:hypothetical protein
VKTKRTLVKVIALFSLVGVMLFAASLAQAQQVVPSSLVITAVPGYSSSPQNVVFSNTGTEKIEVEVSLSGSAFALSENRCGNGVKPGTHCNVYVVYVPQAIETDSGTLTFTFNEQTVTVPITGNAVSIIPTELWEVSHSGATIHFAMSADGNIIPDGELIYVSCIDYEGVNQATGNGPLKSNRATVTINAHNDDWECGAWYSGDPEFAYSYYDNFLINLCHPVKACHDQGSPAIREP